MDRVLLQVTRKHDRRRLEDWLGKTCQLILPHPERPFEGEFDLVIIDGPSLKHLRHHVRVRRKAEEPVFLPFLLLTVRRRGSAEGCRQLPSAEPEPIGPTEHGQRPMVPGRAASRLSAGQARATAAATAVRHQRIGNGPTR